MTPPCRGGSQGSIPCDPALVSSTHTRTETHEERFARLLGEAIDAGKMVKEGPTPGGQGKNASRENAVAITEAETALLWAKADVERKT